MQTMNSQLRLNNNTGARSFQKIFFLIQIITLKLIFFISDCSLTKFSILIMHNNYLKFLRFFYTLTFTKIRNNYLAFLVCFVKLFINPDSCLVFLVLRWLTNFKVLIDYCKNMTCYRRLF